MAGWRPSSLAIADEGGSAGPLESGWKNRVSVEPPWPVIGGCRQVWPGATGAGVWAPMVVASVRLKPPGGRGEPGRCFASGVFTEAGGEGTSSWCPCIGLATGGVDASGLGSGRAWWRSRSRAGGFEEPRTHIPSTSHIRWPEAAWSCRFSRWRDRRAGWLVVAAPGVSASSEAPTSAGPKLLG